MEWSQLQSISLLVLWAVVLVQLAMTLSLARLVGRLMSRHLPASGARIIDPGPEIGTVVENWYGTDLFGQPVDLRFPRPTGVFLLYISPSCTVCSRLLPAARRFFDEIAAEAHGAWVMVLGKRQTQIDYAEQYDLQRQPVLAETQLPVSWHVGGSPYGLWIDSRGEVKAKGMVNNREHLESLHAAVRTGHESIQSYLTGHGQQGAAKQV